MTPLLMFCLLFSGASALTIIQDPPVLYILTKHSAFMSCEIIFEDKNQEISLHHWYLNNTQPGRILENSPRVTITSSTSPGVTSSTSPRVTITSSIIISSATTADSGIYICSAQDSNLQVYKGAGTRLVVHELNLVTVFQIPPILFALEGESAVMSCRVREDAESLQILDYRWYRSNMHRDHILRNSTRVTITSDSLTISSATPDDNGVYFCTAQDSNLHVYHATGTYLGVQGVADVAALPGSNVTFTADVSGSPSDMTWYRNGSRIVDVYKWRPVRVSSMEDRITADLKHWTLVLVDVTAADSGLYNCIYLAENRVRQDFFRLYVYGEEQITAATGSDVTFSADVSDRPSEISWYRDKSKIVDLEEGRPPHIYSLEDRIVADLEQGTLILQRATPADSGQYRAESVVRGKRSTEVFRLQVSDHVCQVGIDNTTMENSVMLRCTCSAEGAPPSKYEWFDRNAHLLSEDPTVSVLKGKKPQMYRCAASNDVSGSNATIIVPARPPGEEQITAVTGSDVTFSADVSDRPSEISWYRDKSKIVDLEEGRPPHIYSLEDRIVADLEQGTLILQRVTPADSGQYRAESVVRGKRSTEVFRLQVSDPSVLEKISSLFKTWTQESRRYITDSFSWGRG
ncbi:hemicentin-1-like isoform X1 [Dendropsophus ebraccatus]|uniref:hemicentin-1-like isoform X1 n=1 Tax=Dendropsophus ebraccatus TaxID=150705 RepID=UPI003832024E